MHQPTHMLVYGFLLEVQLIVRDNNSPGIPVFNGQECSLFWISGQKFMIAIKTVDNVQQCYLIVKTPDNVATIFELLTTKVQTDDVTFPNNVTVQHVNPNKIPQIYVSLYGTWYQQENVEYPSGVRHSDNLLLSGFDIITLPFNNDYKPTEEVDLYNVSVVTFKRQVKIWDITSRSPVDIPILNPIATIIVRRDGLTYEVLKVIC